jgi:hypothetical protein
LIWISPQFGHINFVASAPGATGLPQLVHIVNVNVAGLSVMMNCLDVELVIVKLPYKAFEIFKNTKNIIPAGPRHVRILHA